MSPADRHFLPHALLVLGGLIVWAAHFTAIYAFAAFVCARGFEGTTVAGVALLPFGVLVSSAVAGLLLVAVAVAGTRIAGSTEDDAPRFLRATTVLVAVLSFIAIVWQGVFVLVLPVCG